MELSWSYHDGIVLPQGRVRASQVALVVKNLPVNAGEIRCEFNPMGWEDPMEKGLATHACIVS